MTSCQRYGNFWIPFLKKRTYLKRYYQRELSGRHNVLSCDRFSRGWKRFTCDARQFLWKYLLLWECEDSRIMIVPNFPSCWSHFWIMISTLNLLNSKSLFPKDSLKIPRYHFNHSSSLDFFQHMYILFFKTSISFSDNLSTTSASTNFFRQFYFRWTFFTSLFPIPIF